jgi:uroporphyrinogen decarboxylase
VQEPALACEVTLQPLARYPLDAAILFSDILTVPDAMGLGLYFAEGEGPKFERPLREEWEIRNLTVPDPNVELRYVMDAVAEIRRALDNSVPLIGFSGSPWTLACYMVEGGGSDDFRPSRPCSTDRPDLLHHILEVNAGGDRLPERPDRGRRPGRDDLRLLGRRAVACGLQEFSLAYMQRIVAGLTRERTASASRASCSPRAAACGWKRRSPTSAAMRVGLDWTTDIGAGAPARRRQGGAAGQPRSEAGRAVRKTAARQGLPRG